ncbi:SpvB/TcaC N-terminal domain-containing protein, partial [Salmonella enterica]|uniref:SpvB/TcaC N-terminal domain-containing protein n=1 Tax=Salmonella enterica TaxID=28901 RepID=UPI00398C26E4
MRWGRERRVGKRRHLHRSGERGFAPGRGGETDGGGGNGPLGGGWACGPMGMAGRPSHGVPQYNDSEEFLGPDGEVLVQTLSPGDAPKPVTCFSYGAGPFPQTYTVPRYQHPRERRFYPLAAWLGTITREFFFFL